MKIKTADLRVFKKNASSVRSTKILPITEFLKFETGKITRNAMNSFVVHNADIQCDPFLVDEKQLWGYVDSTSAKEIEIKESGKKVTISAPGVPLHSFPSADVNHFPVISEPGNDPFTFEGELLSAMATALKFTLEETVPSVRSLVFVGQDMIAAGNGSVGFAQKAKGVPSAVFYRSILSAIGQFSQVDFSSNETFYFFDSGVARYGFAKQEIGFFLMPFFTFHEALTKGFVVNKDEILTFNNLCIATSPVGVNLASLEMKKKLSLHRVASDFSLDTAHEVSAKGDPSEIFHYNPAMMNIILNAIDGDAVTFKRGPNFFSISNNEDFVTILMQMQ